MRVCLGGIFDYLHAGHKHLLRTALQLAGSSGSVLIGVTTGGFPLGKYAHASFETRVEALQRFLQRQHSSATVSVVPITDPFGPAADIELDAIVVSPETRPTAERLNHQREQNGKPRLRIVEVPFVLAADGRPISSTRIRLGEITPDGAILHHG